MSAFDIIQSVENDFNARFNFSLFSQSPIAQIGGMLDSVNNRDDFKSRIISLCSMFDHFNKKEMDKITEAKTNGTRKSFEVFIKNKAVNNQCFIDDKIIKPMGMVCLLRDYLVHGKNRNKDKAIVYFRITDPIDDYKESWERVFSVYCGIFESILIVLTEIDLELLNGEKLNNELELALIEQYFKDFSYYFEDRRGILMLKEVLDSSPITDNEISILFNVDVLTVRRLLFPFKNKLFTVKYNSNNETILMFSPYFYEHKALLLEVIGGEK